MVPEAARRAIRDAEEAKRETELLVERRLDEERGKVREQALKDKTYQVIVKVWIDTGGKVARVALVDKTGNPKVDELLEDVLQSLKALREGPPADMPQPIKIRVISRA